MRRPWPPCSGRPARRGPSASCQTWSVSGPRSQRIYLAGPEVFLPDATTIGERKKEICARYDFDAAFPLDHPPATPPEARELFALEVFDTCVAMMRACDLVVANFTPFRGVSMDVGTAVEVGFMFASGKPVYGYTNVAGHYGDRVTEAFPDLSESELVEDFDLVDNLMCEGVVRRSHGIVIRHAADEERLFTDLAGFEACVRRARADRG